MQENKNTSVEQSSSQIGFLTGVIVGLIVGIAMTIVFSRLI